MLYPHYLMEKVALSLKNTKLEQLLKDLEAAGPDPHGEVAWGQDVGKEQLPLILEKSQSLEDKA
jgi:hypothetical protein